jgi:hypothetical protein
MDVVGEILGRIEHARKALAACAGRTGWQGMARSNNGYRMHARVD